MYQPVIYSCSQTFFVERWRDYVREIIKTPAAGFTVTFHRSRGKKHQLISVSFKKDLACIVCVCVLYRLHSEKPGKPL